MGGRGGCSGLLSRWLDRRFLSFRCGHFLFSFFSFSLFPSPLARLATSRRFFFSASCPVLISSPKIVEWERVSHVTERRCRNQNTLRGSAREFLIPLSVFSITQALAVFFFFFCALEAMVHLCFLVHTSSHIHHSIPSTKPLSHSARFRCLRLSPLFSLSLSLPRYEQQWRWKKKGSRRDIHTVCFG